MLPWDDVSKCFSQGSWLSDDTFSVINRLLKWIYAFTLEINFLFSYHWVK